MTRRGLGIAALGLVAFISASCAHDEADAADASPPARDRTSERSDSPAVGAAATLPPSYARAATPEADPDTATAEAGDAECHFDADCDEDQMCDHGSCMKWWRMKGEVPEVAPEALYWQVQRGEVQVVDVRTAAEFRLGRIEGAMHVPIQTLPARVDDLPLDKDKPVVAICLTAHRSIAAVRLLSRHGYDVLQLQGGMTAWARSKLPVVRGRDVDVTQ